MPSAGRNTISAVFPPSSLASARSEERFHSRAASFPTVNEFQVFGKIMDRAVTQVFKEQMEKEHLEIVLPDLSAEKHIRLSELTPSPKYKNVISQLPQIWEPVHHLNGKNSDAYQASCVEFVLEGLHLSGKLSRTKVGEMFDYQLSNTPKRKKE